MPRKKQDNSRLHSFTLSEEASLIIGTKQDQTKSEFVRRSIIHYENWLHTDHKQVTLGDYVGVADVKNINKAFDDQEKEKYEWVSKSIQLNQRLKNLEEELISLKSKKWWQFWK